MINLRYPDFWTKSNITEEAPRKHSNMLESPLYHYTFSLRRHLREFNRSWSWVGGPAQSATSCSASSVIGLSHLCGAWKLLLQHNGVESVRHMLVEKLYLCFMSFLLATSCQLVSLRSFSLVVVNWSCPSYAIGGTRGSVNSKRIEPLWIFKESPKSDNLLSS